MTKLSCNILPPCHPPTNWRKTPKGVTLDTTFSELFFWERHTISAIHLFNHKQNWVLPFKNTCYHYAPILPELETSSMSFPSKMISSFTEEFTHVTPGLILTRLMYFSPRKLRTSTKVLFSETVMLIGKWAYTAFILYL